MSEQELQELLEIITKLEYKCIDHALKQILGREVVEKDYERASRVVPDDYENTYGLLFDGEEIGTIFILFEEDDVIADFVAGPINFERENNDVL